MKKDGLCSLIKNSLSDFWRDGCFIFAASISFFSIMSLIPLLFIVMTIFGHIIGVHEETYAFIVSYMKRLFPGIEQTITNELVKIRSYKALGTLSIIIFLWLSSQVFFSIEYSVNVVFKTQKKRHPLLTTLLSLLGITLVLMFFIISFLITSIAEVIKEHPSLILNLPIIGFLTYHFVLKFLLPLILVSLSFSWIFKVMPNRKVDTRYAITGGVITAALWEIAKHLFTLYVPNIMLIGKIYGSLLTAIIFLLWIYYSSTILLLGAELVYAMDRRHRSH
ncbi:MAG: YihY/virulence factor BrkB family protein [Nitrospirota bacterium]